MTSQRAALCVSESAPKTRTWQTLMQIVLSDHNCEGQAPAIFRALDMGGYLKLITMELRLFVDVGLSASAEDAAVWQHCQDNGFVLLYR